MSKEEIRLACLSLATSVHGNLTNVNTSAKDELIIALANKMFVFISPPEVVDNLMQFA